MACAISGREGHLSWLACPGHPLSDPLSPPERLIDTGHDAGFPPPWISGVPEIHFCLRKSGTPDFPSRVLPRWAVSAASREHPTSHLGCCRDGPSLPQVGNTRLAMGRARVGVPAQNWTSVAPTPPPPLLPTRGRRVRPRPNKQASGKPEACGGGGLLALLELDSEEARRAVSTDDSGHSGSSFETQPDGCSPR
jgi:hypothetical protein